MTQNVSLEEIRQIRACQKAMDTTLAVVDSSRRERWRKLVGAALDEMLQDRQRALLILGHKDPNMRHTALSVLALHWRSTDDPFFIQECENMALNESDLTVRSVALRFLGECYQNTGDRRIGRLLARVVGTETAPTESRRAAYCALCRLHGVFADWPGRNSAPLSPLRVPDDIDWHFVNSFFDESVGPKAVPQICQTAQYMDQFRSSLSHDMLAGLSYYRSGSEALQRRQYETAIGLFSNAVARAPELAGAYLSRARAYVALQKLDEAIRDFTTCIELNPYSPFAYQERGDAYARKGLFDLAQEDYRKAQQVTKDIG